MRWVKYNYTAYYLDVRKYQFLLNVTVDWTFDDYSAW